jgi:hypothetical protein
MSSFLLWNHQVIIREVHNIDLHISMLRRSLIDEDMPPEATQVTHKHVYDGPITRNRAKLLQKEVISFLAETNFNIHKNIILLKKFYIDIA